MNYKIIRSSVSLSDLESRVNQAAAEGYSPTGAPFHNTPTGEWVQSMFRAVQPEPATEVKLREPKKAGK